MNLELRNSGNGKAFSVFARMNRIECAVRGLFQGSSQVTSNDRWLAHLRKARRCLAK